MEVRAIKVTEFNEVELLLRDSFTETEQGYQGEAELVKRIRAEKSYNPEFELVAVEAEQVLGHTLMSEVSIGGAEGIALGPVAVRPGLQNREVGTALLMEAERRSLEAGYGYISILGSPEYYGTPGYFPAVLPRLPQFPHWCELPGSLRAHKSEPDPRQDPGHIC